MRNATFLLPVVVLLLTPIPTNALRCSVVDITLKSEEVRTITNLTKKMGKQFL